MRTSKYHDSQIAGEAVEAFGKPHKAYNARVFNRTGLTKQRNPISEVAAKAILDHGLLPQLRAIPQVSRSAYDASRSQQACEESLGRFFGEHARGEKRFDEERLEWLLYYLSQFGELSLGELGRLESLETPISNQRGHAIDLVSKSAECGRYVIEFKHPDSQESVLRGLLEISTYKQKIAEPLRSAAPALLVWADSKQDAELLAITAGERPHLRQLFQELGVHAYALRWVHVSHASDSNPFESAVGLVADGLKLPELTRHLSWKVEPRFVPA